MSEQRPSRGMEFFNSLRDILTTALADQEKLTGPEADALIRTVEQGVVDFWGGIQIYIPVEALNLLLRNEQIYRDYNGDNIPDLCRKYQISGTQVRKIVNEIRTARQGTIKPKPATPAEESPQRSLGL